jgi:hypothetical protein
MQVLRDYEAVLCTYEDENEDEAQRQNKTSKPQLQKPGHLCRTLIT